MYDKSYLFGFCDDQLWNTTLTWDGPWPQFTDCFQWTVLVWVPCGFLCLTAPVYTAYLAQLPVTASGFSYSRLLLSKLVLLCAALLLTAVDAGRLVTGVSDKLFKPDVLARLILIATILLALALTIAERRKRLVTSGVQFLFWLLLCLSHVVPFYSSLDLKKYENKKVSFSISTIEFGVFLLMLLTQCFADQSVSSHGDGNQKKPCPELTASFPSNLTFWWLNGLLRLGYKTTLTETSLPDIRDQERSGTLVSRVLPRWNSALQRARAARLILQWPNYHGIHRTKYSDVDKTNEKTPLLTPTKSGNKKPSTSSGFPILAWNQNQRERDRTSSAKRVKLASPSLAWTLFRTFWLDLLLAQVWKLPYDLLRICNPLLLGQLVEFVEQHSPVVWRGYVLALTLSASMLVQSLCINQAFHLSRCLGLRMRAVVISAVYRKALTMDNVARSESALGQVVNLMSVDAENIGNLVADAWAVWSSTLQICLSLYLLYDTVGVSMFAGAGFLFLLIPANGVATAVLGNYETQIMRLKDLRVKIMNEMLAGMKIVKYFAWEKSFEQRILAVRELELQKLLYSGYVLTMITFSWTAAPFLTSVVTYVTYVFVSGNNYLDPKTAFVAIALFGVLRFAMNYLPTIITEFIKASVSSGRISTFLRHNDLDENNVTHDKHTAYAVFVRNGTFRWHSEMKTTLSNVYLSIEDGCLAAVVGRVGSGKSSLLSALLGEMEVVTGRINVRGTVAYVPQQAWIQNDSLRNNILFGRPMDLALYEKCLEGCALKPDLDILPAGDLTEIGEKGINLSGGQKQRVSLARALYAQADVYVLDDPLSAVDSHVGRHIFDKVIGHGGLLEGKVRLLVNHGVQYLPSTDHVVVMEDGRVTESGHYEKLLAHSGPFAKLITNYLTQQDPDKEVSNKNVQEMVRPPSETEDGEGGYLTDCSFSSLPVHPHHSISRPKQEERDGSCQYHRDGTIIEEEKVEVGTVNKRVFRRYLRSVGVLYGLALLGTFAAYGALTSAGHIFLSSWTDDPDLANFTKWPGDSAERRGANGYYIGVYGLFGVLQTLCIIIFSVVESRRLVAASRDLHASMLRGLVRAPMSFFDTTPAGRLINRFSKDMEEMDQQLPVTFIMWVDSITGLIFTFVVISYSTPIFIAFIVPVGLVYLYVQRYFISTSRQLKRLSSKTRSPIFNHFTESMTGASVIRAFGAQQRFVLESEAKVDLNQGFMFYNYCVQWWQAVRLESLGSAIILLAAGIAIATREQISGGIMGLSITYAMSLTNWLSWLVRMTSELETTIVSVERIVEYTDIESEAAWDNDLFKSPPGWPSQGSIRFENLSLRYREGLDLVLRNISFDIKPGEKVGIVGRTGAGKSSLTLALFRLVEAAGGRILIDGVNIGMLGLHDLRSKVTILPQDPVLFAGTLRDNLDPFFEFDDEAVWTSLEHAHLKKFVDSLSEGLGHMCGEGGENLSVGQRQLVCLARALLHKTKILVLDEATAAVDMETDELIQDTIRTEFKDCTILTIAHRLNTVMDYDRILVLDKGEVIEFDNPMALLAKPDGLFHELAQAAGLAC